MRRRSDRLTDTLYRRLSGEHVETFAHLAIVTCTVDEEGWPHPAMLSYYEVAALDPATLHLAVYNDSRTCANMHARGAATLIVTDEGLACYVRGRVTPVVAAMASAPYNAQLQLRVDQVVFDEPPPDLEPGAFLTSGITYLARTGESLTRARAVLAELQRRRT